VVQSSTIGESYTGLKCRNNTGSKYHYCILAAYLIRREIGVTCRCTYTLVENRTGNSVRQSLYILMFSTRMGHYRDDVHGS